MEPAPLRRPPPPFRRAVVGSIEPPVGRLHAVDLLVDDGGWLADVEPAASVRLLIPSAVGDALEVPRWNGNEFLLADGRRPAIRTLTPWRTDADTGRLRVGVLHHGNSPLARWLTSCAPGDEVAVSGPGRGLVPDPEVRDWLLVGDESAVPAMVTLLDSIPAASSVRVLVECVDRRSADLLDGRPGTSIDVEVPTADDGPGDTLLRRLLQLEVPDTTLLWAAGEAAAMQRIRRQVDRSGAPRSTTVVRGYWKRNGGIGSAGSKPSTSP